MKDLKRYLAALRKHHFWVLSGLILIVGLTTWARASRDLQTRFDDNRNKLKSTFTMLAGLRDGTKPNEKFTEGLRNERTTLRSQVFDAWKDVSLKQKGDKKEKIEGITVWPPEVDDINKLAPNERIPEDLRQNYMSSALPAEWDRLFKAVQIRHPKGQGNPDDQPARGQTVEYEGIVVWDQEQREALVKRYQVQEIPSDLRVRVTQEDMWVFQSMIDLVVRLNDGATDTLAATVKRIDKLELAQWAVADAQKNPGADLKAKKAEGENEIAAAAPMAPMAGEQAIVALPGAQDHKEDKWLLEGRYLDQKNQPISADDALKNPPFAEFKQMFVSMQFVMDQRRIPELLAECANSPLRIEPRQVLMKFMDIDHKAKVSEGEFVENSGPHLERGPYDCVLEIRGIVYIYNEPQEAKLGTGSAPQPAQRELGIPVPKIEVAKPPVEEEQPAY
ncbi:MAG TPA: hypothetical protein VHV55_05245 [Pirellulales bacterium]|jgi:hypothetical protein|nr:hypothetical protein [Pirellulales bacterium]